MEQQSKLYPQININPQQFRLTEIRKCRDALTKEVKIRRKQRKKLKRIVNALTVVNVGASTVGTVCGSAGVVTLTIGFTAPVAIPLGSVALASAGIGVFTGFGQKVACRSLEKCSQITILAETTLDTVNKIVSKALHDEQISDDEYHQILEVQTNFRHQVEDLIRRPKKIVKNDELMSELKQVLREKH